jgi:Zn-dependent protease with chaperone function
MRNPSHTPVVRSSKHHSAVALTAILSVALVATLLAADGRTILKPGWNMFSPQQDVEVGQQVSPDAERQLRMLNNARVDNYVNELGRRLAAKATGEKYPYTFKVVNDRAINAFALPGGPIYVNRGAIEAADNEAQLAGVIAHEASHVALRHGTNQASKAAAAQMPLAILGGIIGSDSTKAALAQLGASFAMNSVLLKYSRSAESQADVLGTQILYDSGYDPRAMGQFFQILEDQQETKGQVEFFSNHPSPDNRIERVNEEVTALGGTPRNAIDELAWIRRHQALPSDTAGTHGQGSAAGSAGRLTGARDSVGPLRRRQQLRRRPAADAVSRAERPAEPGREQLVDGQQPDQSGEAVTAQVPVGQPHVRRDAAGKRTADIPTDQQASDSASGVGADWPSERFVSVQNSLLSHQPPRQLAVAWAGRRAVDHATRRTG